MKKLSRRTVLRGTEWNGEERSRRRNAKHRSLLYVVYIDIEERKKTRRVRGMTDKENVDFKDSTFPPCGLGSRETEKEGGRERKKEQWEDKVEDEGTTQVWLNSRQRAIMRY